MIRWTLIRPALERSIPIQRSVGDLKKSASSLDPCLWAMSASDGNVIHCIHCGDKSSGRHCSLRCVALRWVLVWEVGNRVVLFCILRTAIKGWEKKYWWTVMWAEWWTCTVDYHVVDSTYDTYVPMYFAVKFWRAIVFISTYSTSRYSTYFSLLRTGESIHFRSERLTDFWILIRRSLIAAPYLWWAVSLALPLIHQQLL